MSSDDSSCGFIRSDKLDHVASWVVASVATAFALSLRNCSYVRNTTALSLLRFRSSSTAKVLSLLDVTCYSTCSGVEYSSSSKRRSRGPVMAAKGKSEGDKQEDGKYKHTIDLPKTAFGLRANSVVREPEIQKMWDENQVFRRVVSRNDGGSFVLHDGPPYANGDLHMGHAMNKILKDIINRYKLLQNFQVHYVPGWDCHGLPIELKVLQSLDQDSRKELTPLKLRAKAAKFAKSTVKTQMASFKRYGVWADWDNPYLTLDPEYEAAQIEVFGQMVLQGYIYRGRKPVHWSPSSRTALAEAELEYPEGHISKSMYAVFPLLSVPTSCKMLEDFLPNVGLAIWTTTPWTVPANAAIAVNSKLQYAIVEVNSPSGDISTSSADKEKKVGNFLKNRDKQFLVVALDLVPTLEAKWGVKLNVNATITGSELENCRYVHPINNEQCPVVIGGDYITTESGTGLVHTAPGHGQEDYVTGLKYDLPMLSPVDDEGIFTEEAGRFRGLDVLGSGNAAVIEYLDNNSKLIIVEPYKHKYPYDWRTKKPTIFRATEQWFASVEGFRTAAMDAINQVTWIPSQAENRISSMTSVRSDWCISRQRTWGVPIPVFYHVDSKEPLMNKETIDHIKAIISQKGSDAWWYMPVEELLPEKYRNEASRYVKGTDTMDVWFDSGSSWAAVLGKRNGASYPADLYLEGTDQHRGWFQSSLLTSVATNGKAPYHGVVTHGFVLDEKGFKMSKSLGNVVDPKTVIEGGKDPKDIAFGADVLRLWVSSVDYTSDVTIGTTVLRQMSDIYRKLRGTLRFLLGNLHDWKPIYAVPHSELPMIDRYALFQLESIVKNIQESYDSYQFFKIFQIIQRFVVVDLSNFYLDIAKDRLYVGGSMSATRRSCQTVLAAHLLSIVRVIAPILPHLAEDVWQHLPFQFTAEDGHVASSVFELRWPVLNQRYLDFPEEEVIFWRTILEHLYQLRTEVNRVLENARTTKLIGSSLEAKVLLNSSDISMVTRLADMCASENDADALHRIFLTSQDVITCLTRREVEAKDQQPFPHINVYRVQILSSLVNVTSEDIPCTGEYLIEGKSEIWIGVSRANGSKCERCWNFSPQVGNYRDHPSLCGRCHNIISQPLPAMAAAS
ncbi:putative isoleucine--tRNA ligase, mitochondrial [Dorcoceras hygrometricum]|uniref:isoleucine--tRNA ligase n=1 Tax=Dorcoceras hygrometricum TaxID=472368 RepID=A0A2Z7B2P8_9LAMI|nr:putative isoleucine--tRNA ligase, mitochondrial [Dorcoceras hygrometricum]